MKLLLIRYGLGETSTLGKLYEVENGERRFLCYTLEDERRREKLYGETAIPEGTYAVTLRTVGGFHARYSERYPEMHRGMLWVRDVPGFEFILFHTGNHDGHTEGCILVGTKPVVRPADGEFEIERSRDAYVRFYPRVARTLEAGETVSLTVDVQRAA